MKRIYACLGIFAAILGLAVWGGCTVRRFQRTMDASLSAMSQHIEQDDTAAAATTAEQCLQSFRAKEHILSIFIRRDYLSSFDMSLCAIRAYAAGEDTKEAQVEIARASSQLYAICHLFLRML